MTFFDKLFTIRNRTSKADNGFRFAIEPLRSSVFEIAKDQIRVVLFRECDKRGRKLLFDSNAVEKLPLASHIKTNDFLCKAKCDQMQNGKLFDFVEVTNSHGYKYKKPSNDVTLLGEMIFGSVAMVFKGGNTCKVHSLMSPKCVMFTNIVHAPQCQYKLSSDPYFDINSGLSSEASLNESSNEKRISSSDSKLYKTQAPSKYGTSTYPCMKHKQHDKKLSGLSEIDKCNPDVVKKSPFHETVTESCLKKISISVKRNFERLSKLDSNFSCEKVFDSGKDMWECNELCPNFLEKKELGQCMCPADPSDSFSDFYVCNRDTFSNACGMKSSLGGLRRRWMQSCSSSVDEVYNDETDGWKSKTRTKLGMGLVVDLSNNLDNELEKFLFNHTIVIESILKKLQSSVETAYIRKENFVDLMHKAFINCQQSMYELINGGKYARPMWLTLTGNEVEDLGSEVQNRIYSQFHENIKDCKKQDTLNNVQLKFLNDFCDILVKFDTKDTNFFVSTLLTAVLTHHLSWVNGIAESDTSLPQHKFQSEIKGPYNPIWAQLNDLNGILGSPLKSARTMITGSEACKNSIASIIQALTYFIRCYNVVENAYDFDFEEITSISETVFKCPDIKVSDFTGNNGENYGPSEKKAEVDIPRAKNIQESDKYTSEALQKSCSEGGIKKSKSCLFLSGANAHCIKSTTLYPDIDELSKIENIQVTDVASKSCDVQKDSCSQVEEYTKKVQKLIRVPCKSVVRHLDQNLSPDEGYDTVDSCTMADVYPKSECAQIVGKKDDVLFVLGENEELVNVNKVALTKSCEVSMEMKGSTTFPVECRNTNLCRSKSTNVPLYCAEDIAMNNCRTFSNGLSLTANEVVGDSTIEEHSCGSLEVNAGRCFMSALKELPMPRVSEKNQGKRRLDVSSVLGSVNEHYNSEQIIQGVLEDRIQWEKALRRDLALYSHSPVLDRNVTETLCIIGDMNTWEVSLFSNRNFTMDKRNYSGLRIGMSQLVADMLESLLHICRIKLPPDFCLGHIEKKLHEIYTKSKSVAELLNNTEMCSMEYLTSRLDISVNDVPLLLSVATTHSPQISSKYGLTFT